MDRKGIVRDDKSMAKECEGNGKEIIKGGKGMVKEY